MLREMAEALEAFAIESPLVLFLEDLQWSDISTLELISVIAQRAEPARLLIVGTYRPVEMLTGDQPLRKMKEHLELHQHSVELQLKLLSPREVAVYLTQRFADGEIEHSLKRVAPLIHERTDGNPLFMVNVVGVSGRAWFATQRVKNRDAAQHSPNDRAQSRPAWFRRAVGSSERGCRGHRVLGRGRCRGSPTPDVRSRGVLL